MLFKELLVGFNFLENKNILTLKKPRNIIPLQKLWHPFSWGYWLKLSNQGWFRLWNQEGSREENMNSLLLSRLQSDRKRLVSLLTVILLFHLWAYIAWGSILKCSRSRDGYVNYCILLSQWHTLHIPALGKLPEAASWWEGCQSNQDWFVLNLKMSGDFSYKVLQSSYDKHPRAKPMSYIIWMLWGTFLTNIS